MNLSSHSIRARRHATFTPALLVHRRPVAPRGQISSSAGRVAALFLAIVALQSAMPASPVQAASGIWYNTLTNNGSGQPWSNAAAWNNGAIASGTSATGDFSYLYLAGNTTVHLDTARTVGQLIFRDQADAYSWTIDNNNTSANTLTLAVTTGTPTITVINESATISAVLAGSQGLNVNPTGNPLPIGSLILTANNSLTGPVSIANGALTLLGSNSFSGGISIGNATLGIASDASLGPAAGNPTIAVNGNGTLQFDGSFALSSSRNIAIGAGFTATLDAQGNSDSFGGVISGASSTSGLTIFSSAAGGTMTLNGAAPSTYTGVTTVSGGTLLLDFSNLATPTNLINPASPLQLAGGTLSIKDKLIGGASQSFSGTTIAPGSSTIVVNANNSAQGRARGWANFSQAYGRRRQFYSPNTRRYHHGQHEQQRHP